MSITAVPQAASREERWFDASAARIDEHIRRALVAAGSVVPAVAWEIAA